VGARDSEDGFCEVFDRYAPAILRYAQRRLDSREAAQDVVSETFTAAWRHWDRRPAAEVLLPWLYAIAGNAVRDQWRSAQRQRRLTGQGGVKLAAWSVIKERHGLVKVTIRELRDPAGLQKTLRAAGVPANVRFVHHFFQPPNSVHLPKGCLAPQMSDKAIATLMAKIEPSNISVPSADAVILRSSAIPHGLGMYLKAWAPKPGTQSAASLGMETDLVQATPQCTG
jgi:hypothetical protein